MTQHIIWSASSRGAGPCRKSMLQHSSKLLMADHTSFGEHGVVLNLRLAKSWAVVGDEDQLGLAITQRLDGGGSAEVVLSTLNDKGQAAVDGVGGLGGLGSLLGRSHDAGLAVRNWN